MGYPWWGENAMPAKVLVVEDDPGIRMLVATTLQSAGLAVLEARDGVEAMDFIPEADLVVLDVDRKSVV